MSNAVYYGTGLLTGVWSAQAKVEDIVPKAAWQRGSDCSVVNDPLEEPSRTPLNAGLPSKWGSVDGAHMFSPCIVAELLNWEL
jgi:hypothetical protein